jgi:hypothetical protein
MPVTFEEWMKKVNAEVLAMSGVSCEDIGDCDYHQWYTEGVGTKKAAVKALKENDFPFEK